ncbi:MAG: hypothetical protein RL670_339 [Actinomycetota bacterium]
MSRFLRGSVAAIMLAASIALVAPAPAQAVCIVSGYPPRCQPVGEKAPAPTEIVGSSSSSSNCDDYVAIIQTTGRTERDYSCQLDAASHKITITVSSSQTGGDPVVVQFQSDYSFRGHALTISRSGEVTFSVDGYLSGTKTAVYLTSTPILLGSYTINSGNKLLDSFVLTPDAPLGNHWLQIGGYLPNTGHQFVVAIPVVVTESPAVIAANQKKVSVAFESHSKVLDAQAQKKLARLVHSIPSDAKSIKVYYRAYFWGGISYAHNRPRAMTSFLKSRLVGETYLPVSPKHIAKSSIHRNLVDVTISWSK